MMKIYRTSTGPVVERAGQFFAYPGLDWDQVFLDPSCCAEGGCPTDIPAGPDLLAPIGSQEVWAAGVTYFRSREARMDESKTGGGSDHYAKVYEADRPELFPKATAHRVIGPGGRLRLRRDSRWNVPEPELTLALNAEGKIIGYTIGNDMSSREIEGENPLYLPQAKIYDGSCALGPGVLVTDHPLPATTEIRMSVCRDRVEIFRGATTLAQMKRTFVSLAGYLFRETSFPHGAFLLTGTGIVPPNSFTLASGDEVDITIAPIGTLHNIVH